MEELVCFLIKSHIIRVISSPSSSTTGLFTLILLIKNKFILLIEFDLVYIHINQKLANRKNMLSKIFPPIHTEGYKFLVIAGFITLVLIIFSSFLGTIGLLRFTVWVYYFFRDPEEL